MRIQSVRSALLLQSLMWSLFAACVGRTGNAYELVYASDVSITNDIFLQAQSGEVANLTHSIESNDINPSLSPDKTRIVFTSERMVNGILRSDLFVLNVETGAVEQITFGPGLNREPAWSADEQEIVFWSSADMNDEILVIKLSSSEIINLSNNPASDITPEFSPDGTQIAFLSNRGGNCDIWLMESDGSGVRSLSNSVEDVVSFAWSPDGTEIAYIKRGDMEFIYFVSLENGETRQIKVVGEKHFLSWGGKEDELLVVMDRFGTNQIFLINLSSGKTFQLTTDSGNKSYPEVR